MIKLTSAALAYVRQPGFSALLFTDVKPPEGQAAAYKQKAVDDLHQMGLTVLAEHIFYGKPTGRRSERTTMAVVAQTTDGTDRWPRSILSGRPLDGSVMQSADSFGAITLKDGSAKAKAQLLPFDGNEYGVFAYVDAALLLNEAHCSERLNLTQRLMVTHPWYGWLLASSLARKRRRSRNAKRRARTSRLRRSSAARRQRRLSITPICEAHSTASCSVARGVHPGGFPAASKLPVP